MMQTADPTLFTFYLPLANIDLPEYYLLLVAEKPATGSVSSGLTLLCHAVEIRAIIPGSQASRRSSSTGAGCGAFVVGAVLACPR